jgi:pimeloyl-ACP methyl ester carboxylesterase
MTPAELRAVSRLGGHVFAGLVARIGQVHQAIADRAFTLVGPAGAPVRLIHDLVAQGTYLAVRGAGVAAGTVGGQAGYLLAAGGEPAGQGTAGNLALAALNAVAGDRLGAGLTPLGIRMAVRVEGRDLELTAREIGRAFPGAAPKMAVFVHGLAESDDSWRRRASQCAPYGDRLQAEFGYTPVYVRYNTGKHVSDSGHDLARLLDELTAAWPLPAEEILLVGHSMGGLVIRSACHYGLEASAAWTERIRHVFYLGSPHLGAPLARAAGTAGWALAKMPETRPFATLAAGPASVRDLRHGYVLQDDWAGCDQDSCLADHRTAAPLLAGANHYVISATVTADHASPVGAVVGDLLVQPASAHGRRGPAQHIPFPVELARGLGGMHHFDLLHHPDVWRAMRGLLLPADR